MNTQLRAWIKERTEMYERLATAAQNGGEQKVGGVYRKVAADFRKMISKDPWLGRVDPTPSAEIMAQHIYDTYVVAAYEIGYSETPPGEVVEWGQAPADYKAALVQTAQDILQSGMIELMVGEAMHRERLETGERARRLVEEWMNTDVPADWLETRMKRLAEGYVDD